MSDRLTLLAAMPVFGGLQPATLELITERAAPLSVPAGQAFFREGDKSQAMYVLEQGRVGIYKLWESADRLLRYMEPGDCFGEMALLDLQARSASALAVADCTAIEITAATLHEIYHRDSEQFTLLHMNMGRELSRRLRVCLDALFQVRMGRPLPAEPVLGNLT